MRNIDDLAQSIAKSLVTVVSSKTELMNESLLIAGAANEDDLSSWIILSILQFAGRRTKRVKSSSASLKDLSPSEHKFSSSEFSSDDDDTDELVDSGFLSTTHSFSGSGEFSQESDDDNWTSFPSIIPPPPQAEFSSECTSNKSVEQMGSQSNPRNPQRNVEFSQDSGFDNSQEGLQEPAVVLHVDTGDFSQTSDSEFPQGHSNGFGGGSLAPPQNIRCDSNCFSQEEDTVPLTTGLGEFSQDED